MDLRIARNLAARCQRNVYCPAALARKSPQESKLGAETPISYFADATISTGLLQNVFIIVSYHSAKALSS